MALAIHSRSPCDAASLPRSVCWSWFDDEKLREIYGWQREGDRWVERTRDGKLNSRGFSQTIVVDAWNICFRLSLLDLLCVRMRERSNVTTKQSRTPNYKMKIVRNFLLDFSEFPPTHTICWRVASRISNFRPHFPFQSRQQSRNVINKLFFAQEGWASIRYQMSLKGKHVPFCLHVGSKTYANASRVKARKCQRSVDSQREEIEILNVCSCDIVLV